MNSRAEYAIPVLAVLIMVLHGFLLYQNIFTAHGAHISLGLALSMAGWISVLLYFCISIFGKTLNLGIIILPMGLLALLAGAGSAGDAHAIEQISRGIRWHIVFAIPTYGILCIACAQACLLILQDRQLRKPNPDRLLPALPAIQTMESNLYWLTLAGFSLMTVNLIMGMISNLNDHGILLTFNHHILLSVIAWLGFGGLLAGRKIVGWRGQAAAKWTITVFALLVLAYFGTRFVNDLVLRG